MLLKSFFLSILMFGLLFQSEIAVGRELWFDFKQLSLFSVSALFVYAVAIALLIYYLSRDRVGKAHRRDKE